MNSSQVAQRVMVSILCVVALCPAHAQDSSKPAAFEVATIKPVDPAAPVRMVGVNFTDDGIEAQNATLAMLVRTAYGLPKFPLDDQVLGGPDWAKSRKYNVQAKMSDEDAQAYRKESLDRKNERMQTMMQALLAERFKLAVHRDVREQPDYELVVAKGGFKLKPSDANDPGLLKGKDGTAFPDGMVFFQRDSCFFQRNSMDQFATFLTQSVHELGRHVVNKTGQSGQFTFRLHWSPNRPAVTAGGEDAPSIFTALQEDAGLRLQPSKGEVEILVIEHVEPPTEP